MAKPRNKRQDSIMAKRNAKDFCEKLKIPGFSKLKATVSDGILIHGILWKVGIGKIKFEENGHLVVNLLCCNEDTTSNWSLWGAASIKILPFRNDGEIIESEVSPYVFDASHFGAGVGPCFDLDELLNPNNKFVKDDTINLEIKYTVENPNDPNRSRLNFEWVERVESSRNNCYFATFRLTVTNALNLMAVQPPRFTLFGFDWIIQVFKKPSSNLGVLLRLERDANEVPLEIAMAFKLISSNKDVKPIEKCDTKQIQCSKKMFPVDIASWDEVVKPENGFVNDGSIVLDIELRKLDPNGEPTAKRTKVNAEEEVKSPQMECPICLDPIGSQKLAAPPCGHMFCFKCIKKAVAARAVCPSCNRKVRSNALRPIYLPAIN